ncbi:hypothetical protein [Gloeothece citriformis]|nr:hypothetical protein [Gloeothece citriformis]
MIITSTNCGEQCKEHKLIDLYNNYPPKFSPNEGDRVPNQIDTIDK